MERNGEGTQQRHHPAPFLEENKELNVTNSESRLYAVYPFLALKTLEVGNERLKGFYSINF